jgi:hypothetical protein
MAGTSPAMTTKSPYAIALRERPRGDRMWTGCAFLPRHGRAKSRPSTWRPQRKPCRIAPGLRASLLQSLLQDDVDLAGTSPAMTTKRPYAIALRERPRGDRMWTPPSWPDLFRPSTSLGHEGGGRKTWMRGTNPRVQPGDAHDEEGGECIDMTGKSPSDVARPLHDALTVARRLDSRNFSRSPVVGTTQPYRGRKEVPCKRPFLRQQLRSVQPSRALR